MPGILPCRHGAGQELGLDGRHAGLNCVKLIQVAEQRLPGFDLAAPSVSLHTPLRATQRT